MNYPDYIQRATVVGLEQFVGLRWTIVACDYPGCNNTFPEDGVGYRSMRESELIRDAKAAGWAGEFTRAGDCRCPEHLTTDNWPDTLIL